MNALKRREGEKMRTIDTTYNLGTKQIIHQQAGWASDGYGIVEQPLSTGFCAYKYDQEGKRTQIRFQELPASWLAKAEIGIGKKIYEFAG